MLKWNYDHQDYLNGGFKPVPPGKYRVRIDNAEEATSKSGRDMIKMTLDVSGQSGKVYYYMVFLPEYKETTNKRLGDIYMSFDIEQGHLEPVYWVGKVGAAQISIEMREGKERNVVDFFIPRAEQGALPPWQEKDKARAGGVINPDMMDLGAEETDAPF